MKCDVGHQLISFNGHACPMCAIIGTLHTAYDGLNGAYEALDNIERLFKKRKPKSKRHAKLYVVPKRQA